MSATGRPVTATRGDLTREQIVEVATRIFGERGYEATSVELVLQSAGVSRGSLYHHFPSKCALFEAVVEAAEARVGLQVGEAVACAGTDGAVRALRAGSREWIKLAGDRTIQQILLIDAPSVLGWERWRQLEDRHALGLVKTLLQQAESERLIREEMIDVMAHVVIAAVNEIALFVARAPEPEAAMRHGSDALLGRALSRVNPGRL